MPKATARQVATIGTAGDGAGQLAAPRGVAVDRQGNIYVADPKRGKIIRYASDGTFSGEWGDPTQLGSPREVIVAPDDTIVTLDSDGQRVARFDYQGTFLGSIATLEGHARGMALGLDGRIYVAYTSNSDLVVLSSSGVPLAPADESVARQRPLDQPTAAIAAMDGALFAYEPGNRRLLGYEPDGRARFTQRAPHADTNAAGELALLPDGRLLLSDPGGQRVMIYGPDGTPLGEFAV